MGKMSSPAWAGGGWTLSVLVACSQLPCRAGETPTKANGATAPALVSLRVVPGQATLRGRRAAQQFVVVGTFTDGLERDVHRSKSPVRVRLPACEAGAGRSARPAGGRGTGTKGGGGEAVGERPRPGQGVKETPPFSFARDIGRILTQRGCNTSDCHGSVKGQKGFKLSMNALYPREDYAWIVKGGIYQVLTAEQTMPQKPRIDRDKPKQSLLLRKATAAVRRDGGAHASRNIRRTIERSWPGLRRGALRRGPPRKPATVVRLEIEPGQLVLDAGGKRQLLVTALRADGHREDMTGKVLYASNNKEVASVSADGVVEAVRTGETAVVDPHGRPAQHRRRRGHSARPTAATRPSRAATSSTTTSSPSSRQGRHRARAALARRGVPAPRLPGLDRHAAPAGASGPSWPIGSRQTRPVIERCSTRRSSWTSGPTVSRNCSGSISATWRMK